MAFFEFPNARTFDSDLTWIIDKIKELLTQCGSLSEAWEKFQEEFQDHLDDTITNIINNMIEDGSLQLILNNTFTNNSFVIATLFGAKGDGVTNDTAALQNVINSYPGSIIFLPSGTYMITQLIIPSNTHIVGASRDSAILKQLPNTNLDILISENFEDDDSTDLAPRNISFDSFQIDGNRLFNTGNGISFYAYGWKFSNLYIHDCGGNGMNFKGPHIAANQWGKKPTINIIDSCHVHYNGMRGLYNTTLFDITLTNSYFASNSQLEQRSYENLYTQSAMKIANCHFWKENDREGHKPIGISLRITNNCNITNCDIEGGYPYPLQVDGYLNRISNCKIYAAPGEYCANIASQNNLIIGCTTGLGVTEGAVDEFKGGFVVSGNFNLLIVNAEGGTAVTFNEGSDKSYAWVFGNTGVITPISDNSNNTALYNAWNAHVEAALPKGINSSSPWFTGYRSIGASGYNAPTPIVGQSCVFWNSSSETATLTVENMKINYSSSIEIPSLTSVMIVCVDSTHCCVVKGS